MAVKLTQDSGVLLANESQKRAGLTMFGGFGSHTCVPSDCNYSLTRTLDLENKARKQMQWVKGSRTSGVGVGEELGEGELDPESEGEMPKSVDVCAAALSS